ncbi:hypothetical protein TNCV_2253381 [Trichonephila clavipes]|nr:hypothetical protein TNCV_2253381 [Trichonephila clavipes]
MSPEEQRSRLVRGYDGFKGCCRQVSHLDTAVQEIKEVRLASADEEAARKYPEKLAKIIKDGEYCAHQVFNADEKTGLFLEKNANPYLHCKVRKNCQWF